jgi:hypothetical protein
MNCGHQIHGGCLADLMNHRPYKNDLNENITCPVCRNIAIPKEARQEEEKSRKKRMRNRRKSARKEKEKSRRKNALQTNITSDQNNDGQVSHLALCHAQTPVLDSHPHVGTSIANHTGITRIYDPLLGHFPLSLDLGCYGSKCRGIRRYFETTTSKLLHVFTLNERHTIKKNHRCVGFLECTQFISTGLPRGGRKCTIAYSATGEMNTYHLSWVHSLVYADHDECVDDVLNVFRWDGKQTVDQNGFSYPSMFDESIEKSWLSHVTFETITFSKKHPLDIIFLNQVCGRTPNNKSFAKKI